MTKHAFNSCDDVIHVWAQRTQNRAHSSNVFFEDTDIIYSYGRHYPLGAFIRNDKGRIACVVNVQGYSVTTAKHISKVRYATNHYKQFVVYDTDIMSEVVSFARYEQKTSLSAALNLAIQREVSNLLRKIQWDDKKRKITTLEKWKNETLSRCDTYVELLGFIGSKVDAATKKELHKISDNPAQLKEAAEKERKAKERKAAAEAKKMQAIAKEAIVAWINGKNTIVYKDKTYDTGIMLQKHVSEVYMRVENDMVKTSKGASFPLEHGLKAFDFIDKVRKSSSDWKPNGHTLHLGHYSVDHIDAQGNVKAGCHIVAYSEIKRLVDMVRGNV